MNADDITTEVMDHIGQWLGEGADVERIHYAILRSTGSIISGLSPSTTPAPFAVTVGPSPTQSWQREDPEWCVGMLRQLAEDLMPDAERDAAPRQLDKYRGGQLMQRRLNVLAAANALEAYVTGGKQVESSEGPSKPDSAQMFSDDAKYVSLPVGAKISDGRVMACCAHCPINRVEKEFSEAREGFKAMKAERDELTTTNARIAAYNTVLRSQRDETLAALRELWAWANDLERGPFVPDQLGADVLAVLNQYATSGSTNPDHPPPLEFGWDAAKSAKEKS